MAPFKVFKKNGLLQRWSSGNQCGQVLPMSLVCLLILCLFVLLMLNLGRLVLQKERVRARTDAVAYSAGVDYARGLNFLSLTNKLLLVSTVASLLGFEAVNPLEVQKVQDLMAGTGATGEASGGMLSVAPLVEASCMYTAYQNDLYSVPIFWNGTDERGSLIPFLNLRRRYLGEAGTEQWEGLQQQGIKPGGSYQPYRGGKRQYVDPGSIQVTTSKTKTGKVVKHYYSVEPHRGSRFIKMTGLVPLDLVEQGPHTLEVWATSKGSFSQTSGSFFHLQELPAITSVSKVEVGGGSMDVLDLDGASYAPYLIPYNRENGGSDFISFEPPKTGIGFVDRKVAEWVEQWIPADLKLAVKNMEIIH